ncbi:hypothetical protein P3342_012894 [Pyrenophora teres f. teres]|nr:hypothetical protein P3342_012894 [Pyrenophora teres f. teres]
MASVAEARRSPFSADPHNPNLHKSIPILPSSSSTLAPPRERDRDAMDITPTSASTMGPPTDRNGSSAFQSHSQREGNGDSGNTSPNGNAAPAVGAAAAAQQPKVVQTAFIHKLYNMLEDQSIQHLISWASTNESFVMSPSSEFSKVLSSYFKHTNISSFVRQLNMYGFHKVSDVFHTGSPDTPLWEFKHGNGNFKRGDLVGLREIKRRASRHALIHRDSFSTPKLPTGPPAGQPVEPMPDPTEARLQNLEHSLYDMHAKMQRSEDTCAYLNQKTLVLAEGMMRCHQWNQELTGYIMAMVPDPENPIHRDVAMMQRDISRQTEMLRALEAAEEPLSARQPYFMQLDSNNGAPISPRQMPQDNLAESRRGSLANMSRQAPYKPPVPAHLAISPRRYGSIGTGNYSPSSARTPISHQPPHPHPHLHLSSSSKEQLWEAICRAVHPHHTTCTGDTHQQIYALMAGSRNRPPDQCTHPMLLVTTLHSGLLHHTGHLSEAAISSSVMLWNLTNYPADLGRRRQDMVLRLYPTTTCLRH